MSLPVALRSSPSVATVSLAVAVTGVTYNGWAALNLSTGLAPKSLSLRSSASGAPEAAFVAAAMADLSCTGSIPLDANPCGCTSGVWMPIGPGAGFASVADMGEYGGYDVVNKNGRLSV